MHHRDPAALLQQEPPGARRPASCRTASRSSRASSSRWRAEYGKKYGRGLRLPRLQALPRASSSWRWGRTSGSPFPIDYYNTPLDEIPMMKGVQELPERRARPHDQLDERHRLLDHLRTGTLQIPARGRLASAVMAPNYYNYLQSGQLFGLIGGLRGAAEYEELVEEPGGRRSAGCSCSRSPTC